MAEHEAVSRISTNGAVPPNDENCGEASPINSAPHELRGYAPGSESDLLTRSDPEAAPAVAVNGASTPGPHAPDRATMSESTENMVVSSAQAPKHPPIPGYVVEQYVGRGGMGVVYRATHTATQRVVALKLTNPGALNDDITRERFVREVHALAAIKHPNIVPVYDAGDWHGFPYCTMEFVPNGTLNQHLERIRTDLPKAIEFMVKVARAVEALHAAGILHRDLKPLNILVGANDEPMVADFGLAKWIDDDSDLTLTGLPVGTRQYMSPEQTLGRKAAYTPACDVWALGVTLYELLTGHRPFRDDGVTDVYHCIRTAEPPPMTALSPDVPDPLQAVVSMCLAKNPEDRYRTAAAFADDLERWLQGKPVLAPLVAPQLLPALDPQPRIKKPRRGRMLLVAGAVVVLAFLVAGAAYSLRTRDTQTHDVQPQQTIAQRVAGGEKVRLTDDKGAPIGSWAHVQGQGVAVNVLDGYTWFSCKYTGLVDLANEPWSGPIRIDGVVVVKYSTEENTVGGIYVGRRVCTGSELNHESLVWCGVAPKFEPKKTPPRRLAGKVGLYWWATDQDNSRPTLHEQDQQWSNDGKVDTRFVPVTIEVREKEIRATVDGMKLNAMTEAKALQLLTLILRDRPQLPRHTFAPPAFGGGIGLICSNGDCAVLNLTVSKLEP